VMPDRSLGRLERSGELRRARRPLAQQRDDAGPDGVGKSAKLPRVLDDEDVLEIVVRVLVDDR
jgi:hypothetical protein